MKHQLKIAAALLSMSFGSAHAIAITAVQTNAGTMTTKSNVCTVDFNTPAAPFAASGTGCEASSYSAPDGAASHVVSGDSSGQYAQPANDPTPYLTVGGNLGGAITISIPGGANYFGFYAGSIDDYNSITFTGTSGSITENGQQLLALASMGNQLNGSQNVFFNIFTDSMFTSIQLNSSQAAFETDNHAFGVASPVPEPMSIALLGLGSLALVAGKRRRRARAA